MSLDHPTPAHIRTALYDEWDAYEAEHGVTLPIAFQTIIRKGIARANEEHFQRQKDAEVARIVETVSLVRGVM